MKADQVNRYLTRRSIWACARRRHRLDRPHADRPRREGVARRRPPRRSLRVRRAHGARSACPRSSPEEIVDVIVGCGFPQDRQGMNLGRRVALLAGLPETVPGTTVNRFCASSLQTIRMAFHAIKAGEGEAFVAAGVESISQVDGLPEVARGAPPCAVRRRRADRERLHPDGPDGGERRRAMGRLARRDGPVRAAVAGTCGRRAGLGLLRPRADAVRGSRPSRTTARAGRRRSRSWPRSSRRSSRAAR